MVCSKCGAAIGEGARFCPACGATLQASTAVPVPMPAYAMQPGVPRVQRHLQTLGVLWLVMAAFRILSWLIALPILAGMFGGWGRRPFMGNGFPFNHGAWMAGLLPLITVYVVGVAAFSLLVGYALLARQPWGRVLAIVAAFLTLLKIPFGTALGIYTLWVLLPAESAAEYERMSE